jgi:hypothetical protein
MTFISCRGPIRQWNMSISDPFRYKESLQLISLIPLFYDHLSIFHAILSSPKLKPTCFFWSHNKLQITHMHNNMVCDSSYPVNIVIIELFLLLHSYSHLQAMFQKILAPGFDTICTDPGSKIVKNVKSLMEEQNNNKNKLINCDTKSVKHSGTKRIFLLVSVIFCL